MVESFKVSDKDDNKTVNNNEKNDLEEVDFDTFLSSAGEFGRYQWTLFFSTFPFYIYGGFTYFGQIFLTETSPNHWCWIPELANLSDMERRTIAIPSDARHEYGYSRCQSYVANWTEVLLTGHIPNSSWPTVACQHGWEFNKSEIPYPTISSELGWVCDKSSYQATAQSFFFVGSIIGGFIIGWIADRFGRLPALACANLIACIGGIASTFSTNFVQFTISRIFVGMGYDNCMMMGYLLALEYVAPKYRTLIANLPFAIFFCLGLVILPWIALACADWKILGLATSIPLVLGLFAPYIMPESPRWLISKNRINDTVDRVLNIAKVNKKSIPPNLIEKFRTTASNEQPGEPVSILEMLKRPLLRRMFFIICVMYMCFMIVFDVSARAVSQLQFNFFVSFTLVSLTELPSLVMLTFILDLTGRRTLVIVALAVCTVFCYLTAFIKDGLGSVVCAIITRFAINMAANTGMQWGAELLPTPVRGTGSSIVHICGYVATAISPFIAYLKVVKYWLPLGIIGLVSIFGLVLAFFLPETNKMELPRDFEESEEMIRNQQFWDFPCIKKKNNTSNGHVNASFELTS